MYVGFLWPTRGGQEHADLASKFQGSNVPDVGAMEDWKQAAALGTLFNELDQRWSLVTIAPMGDRLFVMLKN